MPRLVALLVCVALSLVALQAGAAPCAGFTDLDTSSPFCANVAWMKSRNVTLGCTATQYCPDNNVTRLQMAAFMNRLGEALFPITCTAGQVMKWNGTAWACANDATAGGGGTVSAVTAGAGLTGGTITSSGTIAVDTSYVQRRVAASCAVGSSIRAIAADGTVTCETDDSGPANAFVQGGNAFGAVARLGSTDNHPVEILANGVRALRIEPHAISPNILLGHPTAGVYAGVYGATIGGGGSSDSSASCTTGYGCVNGVTDHFGTVAGGESNKAGDLVNGLNTATHATVGGGFNNAAKGEAATIAGGESNVAGSIFSAVLAGYRNEATGAAAAVAGGHYNVASGFAATVLGGTENRADGAGSLAGGTRANALHSGCMVLADNFSSALTTCGAPNQFIVRARGGVYFFTGGDSDLTYTGSYLPAGGTSWVVYSDREGKREFAEVDPEEVLRKVVAMPIATWQWKAEPDGVRHMGPVAQDFHAAFGLGSTDRGIATVDADGVALAAIQGLNAKLETKLRERDDEIAELRRAFSALAAELRQQR